MNEKPPSNAKQLASPSYRLAVLDQDFLLGDSMRGMVLAVAGISKARWLRWPARIYTDIFRGLPEVVIILLIGLGIGPIVGRLTGNNPYPLGIAALGLMLFMAGGLLLGMRLHSRMDPDQLRRTVYGLLLVSGTSLIIRALSLMV